MKKKSLLVVCAAAGLCMICVLLLIGSMGIYAEKAGTKVFEPEMTGQAPSDTLTQILTENSEETKAQTEGTVSEETLHEIWEKMYEEYAGSEESQIELERQQREEAAADAKAIEEGTEAELDEGYYITLNSAGLGVHEAGLILLKEINRLYPNDTLDDLMIDSMNLECDIGMNSQGYLQWTGRLENGYKDYDENYKSYSFEIDCVSGNIISFGKFHPYQKDKDYSAITWTDEEIKARAKELIETYDLTKGEELDWSNLYLYNGTDQLDILKEELEEEPDLSVGLGNTLIFEKDGKKHFYLCLDWETGEVSNYIWPGRSMPE